MQQLEEICQKSCKAHEEFPHKKVLFIPSESYCAATITIVKGLDYLGFEIYTPYKSNINSWFCNKVLDEPTKWVQETPIDFALSNLHWGTRWDHYEKFGLLDHLKVLIDGDDSRHGQNWLERYRGWRGVYKDRPEEDVCKLAQQPYRWTELLSKYQPDIVFSAQKAPKDHRSGSVYLPFGIHPSFYPLSRYKASDKRRIKVTNIPGDGPARRGMMSYMDTSGCFFPQPIHNEMVRGNWECASAIRAHCESDPNIHSWSRWRHYGDYFALLNDTQMLIYPGVFPKVPQWHSMREFEAIAQGCLVMMARPNIDMSSYPMTELCEFAVWDSYPELLDKCWWLAGHPDQLEEYRYQMEFYGAKYFNCKALANRFLYYVGETDERPPF